MWNENEKNDVKRLFDTEPKIKSAVIKVFFMGTFYTLWGFQVNPFRDQIVYRYLTTSYFHDTNCSRTAIKLLLRNMIWTVLWDPQNSVYRLIEQIDWIISGWKKVDCGQLGRLVKWNPILWGHYRSKIEGYTIFILATKEHKNIPLFKTKKI